jgi:ERCC4-type nuclease
MSGLRLIADHREKAVIPYFLGAAETQQLTTGDYVILDTTGKVILIIERKSISDYAASIKDGRHSNRLRMMTLGVPVFYLLEGKRPSAPNHYINGISWETIESSIMHIQIRDNIKIMWSDDEADSAKLLMRMLKSVDVLILKGELAGAETTLADVNQATAPTLNGEIISAWSALPGIGAETSVFYGRAFTIAEVTANPTAIAPTFMCGRKKISTKTLGAILAIDTHAKSILSKISGIGPVKCAALLTHGWKKLCTMSADEIAETKDVKTGSKKVIPLVLAKKIYSVLHTKVT